MLASNRRYWSKIDFSTSQVAAPRVRMLAVRPRRSITRWRVIIVGDTKSRKFEASTTISLNWRAVKVWYKFRTYHIIAARWIRGKLNGSLWTIDEGKLR